MCLDTLVNRRPVDLDVLRRGEFGLCLFTLAFALGGFALPALDPVIFGRWDGRRARSLTRSSKLATTGWYVGLCRRVDMKKLLLPGVAALLLAKGTAQQSAQAGYYGEDKWMANCRYSIIEKRHQGGDEQPDWLMARFSA
jgi:hypothetical protein